ncbi:hypothetical protein PMAYCL1PPCAC_24695, partial [Pristionchus mayeri]
RRVQLHHVGSEEDIVSHGERSKGLSCLCLDEVDDEDGSGCHSYADDRILDEIECSERGIAFPLCLLVLDDGIPESVRLKLLIPIILHSLVVEQGIDA